MKLKIETIDTIATGYEYDPASYPHSGAFIVKDHRGVTIMLAVVSKRENVMCSLGVIGAEEIIEKTFDDDKEEDKQPSGGHISEEGLLKMMAILQNPENAKDLLK